MTSPNDFDRQLTRDLATLPVSMSDPGVEAIMRAGQRRLRRRHRAGIAVVAVTTLSTGGFVASRFTTDPAHLRVGGTQTAGVRTAAEPDPSVPSATTVVPALGRQPVATTTFPAMAVSRAMDGGAGMVGPGSGGPGMLPLPALPKSSLKWQRVDSSLSISAGFGRGVRNDDGTFLAVSTEPGQTQPDPTTGGFPATIYTSADGISWKLRASPTDITIADAMSSDGSLYAVGTSAGSAPAGASGVSTLGNLVVAESKAGGAWASTVLPLDLRTPLSKGAQLQGSTMAIARSGKATVVTASISLGADYQVIMAGLEAKGISFDEQNDNGFNINVDSVDVFAPPSAARLACIDQVVKLKGQMQDQVMARPANTVPAQSDQPTTPTTAPAVGRTDLGMDGPQLSEECQALFNAPPTIAATYSFTDLGVDPSVVAQLGDRTHVFSSTNGGPFTEIALPGTAAASSLGSAGPVQLFGSDQGFIFARPVFTPPSSGSPNLGKMAGFETQLFTSNDGRSWKAAAPFGGQVVSLGKVGGKVVAAIQSFTTDAATTSPGAATLATIAADGALTPVPADAGVLQFAAYGQPFAMGESGMALVYGGEQGVDPNKTSFVIDGLVFTFAYGDQGPRVTVTDPTTKEVLVADQPLEQGSVTQIDATMVASATTIPAEKFPGQQPVVIPAHNGIAAKTIALDEIYRQQGIAYQMAVARNLQILDSTDGAKWSTTKLSDVIDVDAEHVLNVSKVIVDKDKIIVNVIVSPTTGTIPRTITFVARRG
jgi:hypothetical protein